MSFSLNSSPKALPNIPQTPNTLAQQVFEDNLNNLQKKSNIQYFSKSIKNTVFKNPHVKLPLIGKDNLSLIMNNQNNFEHRQFYDNEIENKKFEKIKNAGNKLHSNSNIIYNNKFTQSQILPNTKSQSQNNNQSLNQDQNTVLMTVQQPTFVNERKLVNKQHVLVKVKKKQKKRKYRGVDNEIDIKFPIHRDVDFVDRHAKGFQNRQNIDLFKHYLRLYMKNKFKIGQVKKERAQRIKNIQEQDKIREKELSNIRNQHKQTVLEIQSKNLINLPSDQEINNYPKSLKYINNNSLSPHSINSKGQLISEENRQNLIKPIKSNHSILVRPSQYLQTEENKYVPVGLTQFILDKNFADISMFTQVIDLYDEQFADLKDKYEIKKELGEKSPLQILMENKQNSLKIVDMLKNAEKDLPDQELNVQATLTMEDIFIQQILDKLKLFGVGALEPAEMVDFKKIVQRRKQQLNEIKKQYQYESDLQRLAQIKQNIKIKEYQMKMYQREQEQQIQGHFKSFESDFLESDEEIDQIQQEQTKNHYNSQKMGYKSYNSTLYNTKHRKTKNSQSPEIPKDEQLTERQIQQFQDEEKKKMDAYLNFKKGLKFDLNFNQSQQFQQDGQSMLTSPNNQKISSNRGQNQNSTNYNYNSQENTTTGAFQRTGGSHMDSSQFHFQKQFLKSQIIMNQKNKQNKDSQQYQSQSNINSYRYLSLQNSKGGDQSKNQTQYQDQQTFLDKIEEIEKRNNQLSWRQKDHINEMLQEHFKQQEIFEKLTQQTTTKEIKEKQEKLLKRNRISFLENLQRQQDFYIQQQQEFNYNSQYNYNNNIINEENLQNNTSNVNQISQEDIGGVNSTINLNNTSIQQNNNNNNNISMINPDMQNISAIEANQSILKQQMQQQYQQILQSQNDNKNQILQSTDREQLSPLEIKQNKVKDKVKSTLNQQTKQSLIDQFYSKMSQQLNNSNTVDTTQNKTKLQDQDKFKQQNDTDNQGQISQIIGKSIQDDPTQQDSLNDNLNKLSYLNLNQHDILDLIIEQADQQGFGEELQQILESIEKQENSSYPISGQITDRNRQQLDSISEIKDQNSYNQSPPQQNVNDSIQQNINEQEKQKKIQENNQKLQMLLNQIQEKMTTETVTQKLEEKAKKQEQLKNQQQILSDSIQYNKQKVFYEKDDSKDEQQIQQDQENNEKQQENQEKQQQNKKEQQQKYYLQQKEQQQKLYEQYNEVSQEISRDKIQDIVNNEKDNNSQNSSFQKQGSSTFVPSQIFKNKTAKKKTGVFSKKQTQQTNYAIDQNGVKRQMVEVFDKKTGQMKEVLLNEQKQEIQIQKNEQGQQFFIEGSQMENSGNKILIISQEQEISKVVKDATNGIVYEEIVFKTDGNQKKKILKDIKTGDQKEIFYEENKNAYIIQDGQKQNIQDIELETIEKQSEIGSEDISHLQSDDNQEMKSKYIDVKTVVEQDEYNTSREPTKRQSQQSLQSQKNLNQNNQQKDQEILVNDQINQQQNQILNESQNQQLNQSQNNILSDRINISQQNNDSQMSKEQEFRLKQKKIAALKKKQQEKRQQNKNQIQYDSINQQIKQNDNKVTSRQQSMSNSPGRKNLQQIDGILDNSYDSQQGLYNQINQKNLIQPGRKKIILDMYEDETEKKQKAQELFQGTVEITQEEEYAARKKMVEQKQDKIEKFQKENKLKAQKMKLYDEKEEELDPELLLMQEMLNDHKNANKKLFEKIKVVTKKNKKILIGKKLSFYESEADDEELKEFKEYIKKRKSLKDPGFFNNEELVEKYKNGDFNEIIKEVITQRTKQDFEESDIEIDEQDIEDQFLEEQLNGKKLEDLPPEQQEKIKEQLQQHKKKVIQKIQQNKVQQRNKTRLSTQSIDSVSSYGGTKKVVKKQKKQYKEIKVKEEIEEEVEEIVEVIDQEGNKVTKTVKKTVKRIVETTKKVKIEKPKPVLKENLKKSKMMNIKKITKQDIENGKYTKEEIEEFKQIQKWKQAQESSSSDDEGQHLVEKEVEVSFIGDDGVKQTKKVKKLVAKKKKKKQQQSSITSIGSDGVSVLKQKTSKKKTKKKLNQSQGSELNETQTQEDEEEDDDDDEEDEEEQELNNSVEGITGVTSKKKKKKKKKVQESTYEIETISDEENQNTNVKESKYKLNQRKRSKRPEKYEDRTSQKEQERLRLEEEKRKKEEEKQRLKEEKERKIREEKERQSKMLKKEIELFSKFNVKDEMARIQNKNLNLSELKREIEILVMQMGKNIDSEIQFNLENYNQRKQQLNSVQEQVNDNLVDRMSYNDKNYVRQIMKNKQRFLKRDNESIAKFSTNIEVPETSGNSLLEGLKGKNISDEDLKRILKYQQLNDDVFKILERLIAFKEDSQFIEKLRQLIMEIDSYVQQQSLEEYHKSKLKQADIHEQKLKQSFRSTIMEENPFFKPQRVTTEEQELEKKFRVLKQARLLSPEKFNKKLQIFQEISQSDDLLKALKHKNTGKQLLNLPKKKIWDYKSQQFHVFDHNQSLDHSLSMSVSYQSHNKNSLVHSLNLNNSKLFKQQNQTKNKSKPLISTRYLQQFNVVQNQKQQLSDRVASVPALRKESMVSGIKMELSNYPV